MILVDSSVWIDYFNGAATIECDVLDALLGRELVLIGRNQGQTTNTASWRRQLTSQDRGCWH